MRFFCACDATVTVPDTYSDGSGPRVISRTDPRTQLVRCPSCNLAHAVTVTVAVLEER